MKTTALFLALCAASSATLAQGVPTPVHQKISIGDTWSYKRTVTMPSDAPQTRVIFKIEGRAPGEQLQVRSLAAEFNGKRPMVWIKAGLIGADTCLVDFYGGGTLGLDNTCATFLTEGMDWDSEVTEKGVRTRRHHEVIGTEEIKVGAGSFNAIKISAKWEVAKLSTETRGKSGKPGHEAAERYNFVYWYAPETRSMVKVEREFRNAAGAIESRVVEELISYHATKGK